MSLNNRFLPGPFLPRTVFTWTLFTGPFLPGPFLPGPFLPAPSCSCRSLATLSTTDQRPASSRGVRHLPSNAISPNHITTQTDSECRRLTGLTRRQRRVCRRNAENMVGVRHGAQLAIGECQHQFQHRRWNCTVIDRINVFGKVVTAGRRHNISMHFKVCTLMSVYARPHAYNILLLHVV